MRLFLLNFSAPAKSPRLSLFDGNRREITRQNSRKIEVKRYISKTTLVIDLTDLKMFNTFYESQINK